MAVSFPSAMKPLAVLVTWFALASCTGATSSPVENASERDASSVVDAPDAPELSSPVDAPSGGRTFDPCVPEPKPGFDPTSRGLEVCCGTGPAHCVPSTDVLPRLAAQLDACASGDTLCMPDPIIRNGGQYVPAHCTAALLNAPGVCLSTCLPLVAKNPQAALLARDGCGDGEVCVPCKNPLNGESTRACELNELLCAVDDGGIDASSDGRAIQCPYDGPPLVDPQVFPPCAPACAGAHCVPASLVPAGQQTLLSACPASGGVAGLCAPDPIIASSGNSVPKSCKSLAGVEGRCLSTCLTDVAKRAQLLPTDSCGAGEKCVPCFDPTSTDPSTPTGACSLACDMPKDPPFMLSCPWTGPAVVEPASFPACDPACDGAHCVPSDMVPADQRAKLAACSGGYCLPDPVIASANHFVPPTCTSLAGAEGRCVSKCLPDIAAKANLLPQSTCPTGTICAPCYDPTSASPTDPTGACSLGCDAPKQPPLILTCPWNGPPVLDPSTLPACSPECGGAHCLPADLVPQSERALLAACPGGYCTPDPIIASGGNNYKPNACVSIAGAEGRCLSTCLPSVAAQPLLPQATCAQGRKCVPCYDPTSATLTAPTGACSLGCDAPGRPPITLTCPWTGSPVINASVLPTCDPACSGAHCLPDAYVPPSQAASLAQCGSGASSGRCAPDDLIAAGGNVDPPNCIAFAGTPAEGRCLSQCLPAVSSQPNLEASTCAAGQRCAPCSDPITGATTGACGTIGCDQPAPVPPFTFPTCCNNTGTCVPRSQIPDAQEASLGQRDCPLDVYLCAPTDQLPGRSPQRCHVPISVIPPFSWDSVCVPDCIIGANAPFIPRDGCPVNWSCPPP